MAQILRLDLILQDIDLSIFSDYRFLLFFEIESLVFCIFLIYNFFQDADI